VLLAIFAGAVVIFGIINPSIVTLASFYSLTRACIIPAVFSLSLMLVMVQGGIDMSFAAVGSFAGYSALYIFTQNGWMETHFLLLVGLSVVFGIALQLINWFLIAILNLQSFITTLATQTLLRGAMFAFVSTSYIYDFPRGMTKFSTLFIARAAFPDGNEAVLHISVFVVIVMYLLAHIILQYTMLGRSMYAIGDDVTAAQRAGIKVARVRFWVFVMAGIVCGIGGIFHDALSRASMPMAGDIVGWELNNLAAVVLGIGVTKRAKGSVMGTLLGVIFLRFVGTNLIMLGIPSYWQQVISGIIIFIGIAVQMSKKKKRKGGSSEKQANLV
jgi:simple sugar transport system permease protein